MARSKRKAMSATLRWHVFARDNFTCRYCGAQAGMDGVPLAVDHLVSVVDGGTNAIDNLITACQKCNGGKGARSLSELPSAGDVADRMHKRAESLREQARLMRESLDLEKQRNQEAINLKGRAYGQSSVRMFHGEVKHIIRLCEAHGADNVFSWFQSAAEHGVPDHRAIKYVYGIIRNIKQQMEDDNSSPVGGDNA